MNKKFSFRFDEETQTALNKISERNSAKTKTEIVCEAIKLYSAIEENKSIELPLINLFQTQLENILIPFEKIIVELISEQTNMINEMKKEIKTCK